MGILDFLFGGQSSKISPLKISNPATDLTLEQRYAIMGLIAFIQGFSPNSAYSEDANEIAESTASMLGLSFSQVASYLQSNRDNGTKLIRRLKSIRDRDFMDSIYTKCHTIARISLKIEAEEILDNIFKDLGYSEDDLIDARFK